MSISPTPSTNQLDSNPLHSTDVIQLEHGYTLHHVPLFEGLFEMSKDEQERFLKISAEGEHKLCNKCIDEILGWLWNSWQDTMSKS